MNPLRPAILAAAKSTRMRNTVTRAPVTRRIVRRFVAGETRADALAVVSALLASGRKVSVDYLGEDTAEHAQATAAVTEYLELISDLGALRRGADTEISVKLSAIGQALDPELATRNLRLLCAAADAAGVVVTVDAEDHTTTDATQRTVYEVQAEYPWLGVAVQAYLHRTEADCQKLAAAGARVRLCKGAYRETETVAYQDKQAINEAYLRSLAALLEGDGYPMVATHDPALIAAAADTLSGTGLYEHQMLYGVNDSAQRELAAGGTAVRVYVPYGEQWYGYLMRRLAERPANLTFFLRALVRR